MTYIVALFDNTVVEHTKEAILAWYREETSWQKDIDYFNYRTVHSLDMKLCFAELMQIFPPMLGELAPSADKIDNDPKLEEKVAEYTFTESMIYMVFSKSKEIEACALLKKLANKHHVGYFDYQKQEIIYNRRKCR